MLVVPLSAQKLVEVDRLSFGLKFLRPLIVCGKVKRLRALRWPEAL
jgi:hypothetical protein